MIVSREQALKIEVGDYVIHIVGEPELELVKNIEHQTHGIKDNDEDYCRINGYYWHYDDIIGVYKGGIDKYDK
jgi:hypothetical protein